MCVCFFFNQYFQVEFSPTLQQLATIVGDIGKYHLVKAIADIKRLPDLLTTKKSTKEVSLYNYKEIMHTSYYC